MRSSASRSARQLVEPRPDLVAQARADQVVGDLAVEDPVTALGHGDHVGQQVVQFEHLDAAVAHLGDEVEVVALGLLHPDDVVEEQVVAGVRGEPLVGESRRADQHSSQPARLRPHPQPGFGAFIDSALSIGHRTERLPVAISASATDRRRATTATTTFSAFVKTGNRLSLRAQT